MNSQWLVLSGFMAWFGVPALTVIAASILWRKKTVLPQRILHVIAALAIGAALFVWLQWFHNPLPNDETLTKHFNVHRAEFEQLMKGARNYRVQVPRYEESPEGKVLTERLRVSDVGQGGSMSWFPDPYSERVARLKGQYFGHSVRNVINRTPQEQVNYWKTNIPELFEGMAPVTEAWQLNKLAGVIRVGAIKMEAHPRIVRLGQGFHHLYMEYWHFPQPPRIRNGRILIPGYGWQDEPTVQEDERVLDSLDDFPPYWQPGECVLKRIDPHWFIALCKSY